MPLPFEFDPERHAYTVDGVQVPSVTQCLEGVGVSDFSMVPYERLQYAKDLGTAVHQATEAYDQDDLDFASVGGTVVEPYLCGWNKFRKETGFIPRLIEHRGVADMNGQRYGFCIDREGDFRGRPTVIDIKTGAVSRSWAIQLAAYEMALFRQDGAHRARLVIKLDSLGGWRPVPFSAPMAEDVWRWCLALETWKQSTQ